jgi:glycosyltransferase involved in cell wall biosynthesis
MAAEGLSGARAVVGGSEDVLARAESLVPTLPMRRVAIAPGVDVEAFAPLDRVQALLRAAELLDRDAALRSGRPVVSASTLESALRGSEGAALDALAGTYDQNAPDRDAPDRLREVAEERGPIVGYLGKLIPQKGVDLLLQALALLHDRVRGLIVGFGSYRERLEALVTALDSADGVLTRTWSERIRAHTSMPIELTADEIGNAHGLRGRVTFTGRLDHRYAPFALASMDVLVVPSILDEAFGMVAVEGAAAGALPLVARHSGLAEVAAALEGAVDRPGLFSFEPGPGAVHRIAEGIEGLLTLPQRERAELRRAVSAFAHQEWTWDRTADRLLHAATG